MIKRYLDDDNLNRLVNDFQFLPKLINSFKGELEFSLRDKYFNLYFRGNSAARVKFIPNKQYRIEFHNKFFPTSIKEDERFLIKSSGKNQVIETTNEFLHPLLQKSRLAEIYSKIKKENYSEELIFEQMIISDNLNREDFFLIDRQVTDTQLNRKRIDLLALKQVQDEKYQLLVLEVKMGRNPELKDKVANQLKTYVDHVNKFFLPYKSCYEKQYNQKKLMGLFNNPKWENIEIQPGVLGMIVVGGYSGIAKEQIKILKTNYPKLEVQLFDYKLV